jgi:putative Mg2+ transporter-C (MgtC) family protein
MMAGAGAWPYAVLLTGLVVFINLGLRPLVKWLKRKTKAGVPISRSYRVVITCRADQEAAVRALVLRTLTIGGLHLSEVELRAAETGDGLDLSATVTGEGVTEEMLELAVQRLVAEPGLMRVRWQGVDEG